MASKEDWNAAMSSEIFKEYVKIALASEPIKLEINEDQTLEDFKNLQSRIRCNPKMLQVFKILQQKFATDLHYRQQVNPKFVEGVMLLDLNNPIQEE